MERDEKYLRLIYKRFLSYYISKDYVYVVKYYKALNISQTNLYINIYVNEPDFIKISVFDGQCSESWNL